LPIRSLSTLGAASFFVLSACRGVGQDPATRSATPLPLSAPRLETVELTSQVFGNTRLLRALLPPGYDEATDRRYPVLYLLDGQTLFDAADSYTTHAWEVDDVMARLLAEGALEPLIVVGIDNPGLTQRPNELLPWFDEYLSPPLPDPQGKRFPQFLVTEVMPRVESRYRVLEGAEHTGLGGVSYGGLASLYAVIHRPGVFGRLLIESPGLYVNDAAVLEAAEAFDDWPRKVSLGVGTNEENREACDPDDMTSEAVRDVLRLEGILEGKGLSEERLLLQVALCGEHDERHYRRRLPRALGFLYGSAPGGRVIRRLEKDHGE
jgi:predicted alpha/beta superfamily hydrolase